MTNKYYQKHKERLRKEAHKKCQNVSEEKREKKTKKVRERYKNLPEQKKQRLLEYMKSILGILFSTAVRAVVVAKPVILSILSSISLVLAL